jgi:hypothetical protein
VKKTLAGNNPRFWVRVGGASPLKNRRISCFYLLNHWLVIININAIALARRLQSVWLVLLMTLNCFLLRCLGLMIFWVATALGAQPTVGSGAEGSAKEKIKAETAKSKEEANAQRDRMISEYEALAKQLKDSTEAQKKVILERMQDRKKAFEEAQNLLHKQIRDEQRRQRQNASPRG